MTAAHEDQRRQRRSGAGGGRRRGGCRRSPDGDGDQCSPQAGLARRVTGGPWAGPGPGAKIWESTGSGRVRAAKVEKAIFVPYEVSCGTLPTILCISAPLSIKHHQAYKVSCFCCYFFNWCLVPSSLKSGTL